MAVQALTGYFTIGVFILVGVVLAHFGVLSSSHQRMMSKVALLVSSPALMFMLMSKADLTRVFGIAGYSGMGKTTLLERLLPELRARGLTHILECGPGKVLTGLVKRIDKAIDVFGWNEYRIRAEGLTDASGYPRLAASFGGGGTPQFYMGTFPAFLSAWWDWQ